MMLGIGGWTALGGVSFNAIAGLLTLISALEIHEIAGLLVAQGFNFAAPLLQLSAAGVIGLAFTGSRQARGGRLRLAAVLLAGGLFATGVAFGVVGGVFAAHHFPGSVTATEIAYSVTNLIAAAVFIVAAAAFGTGEGGSSPLRDGRLAAASWVFVAAQVAQLVTAIIALSAGSNLEHLVATQTSAVFALLQAMFELGAGVLIAVAFLGSSAAMRGGRANWRPSRDRLISGAFSGITVGFLFEAISDLIAASHRAFYFDQGLAHAGAWLEAVASIILVGAAGCAASGFMVSGWRRAN
jgi:hypothetical protein